MNSLPYSIHLTHHTGYSTHSTNSLMPLLHPFHELFDEPPLPLYTIFHTSYTPNRVFHTFHELLDALVAPIPRTLRWTSPPSLHHIPYILHTKQGIPHIPRTPWCPCCTHSTNTLMIFPDLSVSTPYYIQFNSPRRGYSTHSTNSLMHPFHEHLDESSDLSLSTPYSIHLTHQTGHFTHSTNSLMNSETLVIPYAIKQYIPRTPRWSLRPLLHPIPYTLSLKEGIPETPGGTPLNDTPDVIYIEMYVYNICMYICTYTCIHTYVPSTGHSTNSKRHALGWYFGCVHEYIYNIYTHIYMYMFLRQGIPRTPGGTPLNDTSDVTSIHIYIYNNMYRYTTYGCYIYTYIYIYNIFIYIYLCIYVYLFLQQGIPRTPEEPPLNDILDVISIYIYIHTIYTYIYINICSFNELQESRPEWYFGCYIHTYIYI